MTTLNLTARYLQYFPNRPDDCLLKFLVDVSNSLREADCFGIVSVNMQFPVVVPLLNCWKVLSGVRRAILATWLQRVSRNILREDVGKNRGPCWPLKDSSKPQIISILNLNPTQHVIVSILLFILAKLTIINPDELLGFKANLSFEYILKNNLVIKTNIEPFFPKFRTKFVFPGCLNSTFFNIRSFENNYLIKFIMYSPSSYLIKFLFPQQNRSFVLKYFITNVMHLVINNVSTKMVHLSKFKESKF